MIAALDPAQPGFEFCDKAVRLDKEDAQFVDAIHTNAAPLIPTMGFGMMNPTGTAFYTKWNVLYILNLKIILLQSKAF